MWQLSTYERYGVVRQLTKTLGEAFPEEQARLRVILGHYKEIGPVGAFGVVMIEDTLKRADKAVMEQDLPAMIALYLEMQGYKE